jgi:hypothetical protein
MIPSGYSNGTLHSLLPEVKEYGLDLVTNGTFSNGITSWTPLNTVSVVNNQLVLTGSSSNVGVTQVLFTAGSYSGKKVRLKYTVIQNTLVGSGLFRLGGLTGGSIFSGASAINLNTSIGDHSFEIEVSSSGNANVLDLYLTSAFTSGSLVIDNVSVKEIDRLSGDFTFSRGSNLAATRVNAEGLIEKGRENLLLYSENFSLGTAWFAPEHTNAISGELNPISQNNSYKITCADYTGSTNFVRIVPNTTYVSNQIYTYSLFVKYSTFQYLRLCYINYSTANYYLAVFDILNGEIAREHSTSLVSSSSSNIEDYGNGWFRISITAAIASSAGNAMNFEFNKVPNATYTLESYGRVTQTTSTSDEIYVSGAQLEVGLVATDYIPTNGSTGKAGVLENTPRLNYEGSCPYLLLEPARTNYVAYSEDFSNAAWVKSLTPLASINLSSTTSPDGFKNASTYYASTSGAGVRYIVNTRAKSASAITYSYSVYVKAKELNFLTITCDDNAGNGFSGGVNLTTGETTGGVLGTGVTFTSISALPCSNGWYKCVLVGTSNSATLVRVAINLATSLTTGFPSVTLNANDGVYIWGAQLEQGSYPTSYIPTYGTIQTRSGDVCTGAGDSSVFNDSEGVLFAEVAALADDGIEKTINIFNNISSGNRLSINYRAETGRIQMFLSYSGGTAININILDIDKTEMAKIAFKYKNNDSSIWYNGIELATDTIGTTSTSIGFDTISFIRTNPFYGKVKSLIYFPTALTDDELQALTSSNINEVLRTYQGKLSFIDATYEGGLVDSNLTNLF